MIYWIAFIIIYITNILSKNIANTIIFVMLFVMAAYIAPEVSHDYFNYYNGFYINSTGFFPEPLSKLIFRLPFNLGLSMFYSLLVFAFLNIYLKFRALKLLNVSIPVFFIIYFSKLYLLHDLTQLRAAVAVSLCLFAFYKYINYKNSACFLYIFVAFLFHFSALLFFIIFLLGREKPRVWLWLALLLASVIFSFIDFKPLLYYIFTALHAPENYIVYISDASDFKVNPFNSLSVINIIIFTIISLNSKFISSCFDNVCYKLYGISIISFYVFLNFPVLSFRISEFFIIYQALLLAKSIYLIRNSQKFIYLFLLFAYSAFQLYITYNVSEIISPYRMLFMSY